MWTLPFHATTRVNNPLVLCGGCWPVRSFVWEEPSPGTTHGRSCLISSSTVILKRLRRMRKRPRKEQRKKFLPLSRNGQVWVSRMSESGLPRCQWVVLLWLLLQELVKPSALCPQRTGLCPRWRTGPLSLCQQDLPPSPPTGEEPLPRAGTKETLVVLVDQYESHTFLVTDLVACEM